jgi:histidinol-phosphate/aromatic aminotransferase/cobyric acid decarboxylase-like protein
LTSTPAAFRFSKVFTASGTRIRIMLASLGQLFTAGKRANAAKTFEGMKAAGVLIKNVSKMHPLLANCLRLTVGTADDNTRMLAALESSL